MQTNFCNITGLDINVCPIPVKIDVGQLDLVSQLSDGTSEKKMTVLPFEGYFLCGLLCPIYRLKLRK